MNLTSHSSKTILFTSHNWIEMVQSFSINYCLSDCPNWGERIWVPNNYFCLFLSPIAFRFGHQRTFSDQIFSSLFSVKTLKAKYFADGSYNVDFSGVWTCKHLKHERYVTLFREMDKMLHLSGTNCNESMSSTTSEKSKRNDWTKMIACLTNNVSEIRQLFSVDHRESIAWMTASPTH